jgi:uncharacterized protein
VMGMLVRTFDAMAEGGIRDQLGGGFHRYSTDERWLVPHFEIMLYDNAMLGWVYAEAYRQMNERRYAAVARDIFDFTLREMTSPEGAFFTAFDAEVDAQEGLSYLWTAAEIEAVLGPDDAKVFNRVYGVDRGPNFADPHHGNGQPDKSILFLPRPIHEAASELKLEADVLEARLAPLRQKLYQVRLGRKQPLLDTKIITSWNALMIRAMAHGGRVLSEARYIEAAGRAADYLLRRHRGADGLIHRTSRDGKAKYDGFIDDYAFLAQALLALFDATNDNHWRDEAAGIARSMQGRFADEAGGFFFTDRNARELPVRQMASTDSPLPSGNAVAAMVLAELKDEQQSRRTISRFAAQMEQYGEGMSSMVQAALLHVRQYGPFNTLNVADSTGRVQTPLEVAKGLVSTRAQWRSDRELVLYLDILNSFHINAPDVGTGEIPLIGTSVAVVGEDSAEIDYPPGETMRFAFIPDAIRVYAQTVEITVRFQSPRRPDVPIVLALTYQACNDQACFPPVTKRIEAPVSRQQPNWAD